MILHDVAVHQTLCVVSRIMVDDNPFVALVVVERLGEDAVERLAQEAAPIGPADAQRDVPLSGVYDCQT